MIKACEHRNQPGHDQRWLVAFPMISSKEILKLKTDWKKKKKSVTCKKCLFKSPVALLPCLGFQVDIVPLYKTSLRFGGIILPTQSEGVGGQVSHIHFRVV